MPQRKRRAGKAWKDSPHARFYLWEMKSAAFRSLSVGARALLLELKSLYNGNNNGALFLSVREAARRLNVGKTCAAGLFHELAEHGFIRPAELGAFNLKAQAGMGKATTWILTEHPVGDALQGTKDFMRWTADAPSRPTSSKALSAAVAENHFTVRPGGRSVRPSGPLERERRQKRPNRPPLRTLSSILRANRSAPADTGISTMGGGVASHP